MFEDIEELGVAAALAAAMERRRVADGAEAELLGLAAHWADLHAVLPGEGARIAVPGMERLVRLAGEGTPEVAEFAPAELGAALGMSTFAASCLVGDALELRHRLPRLWARVRAGTLQAWRARKIADHTKILSPEAAAWVDGQAVGFAHKIGLKRVLDLVAVALMRFDPEEAARRVKAARDGRGVFVGEEMRNGTRSMSIEADALDVAEFDATISAIAEALAELGDEEGINVRRAKAIGVVADPQGALDLLTGGVRAADRPGSATATDERSADAAGAADAADAADAAGSEHDEGARDRGGFRWRAGGGGQPPVLYVHLHADSVAAHGRGAVARVEGGGAVLAEQVLEWLGRGDFRIQPVIDLADATSVDGYEAPRRMREVVVLRNPCCLFPWCNHLSRKKDLDHIEPYTPRDGGGPPGQTRADNLAGLCRRHHRLRTHGGWSYTMVEPGMYLWRSPRGQRYLVDHSGTTNLSVSADALTADVLLTDTA